MSASSSNSHSPCAACKFLRRKCTQECVFAPYFPPDQPQKFASVHRVYGASNVAKILNEMPVGHREEAVASLAYEAEARLRDPIYGCVGFISYLHAHLKQVQSETIQARKELAAYIAASGGTNQQAAAAAAAVMMMYPQPPPPVPVASSYPTTPGINNPHLAFLQHQQHQGQLMYAASLENQPFPAATVAAAPSNYDASIGVGVADMSQGSLGLVDHQSSEIYPVAHQIQAHHLQAQPHHHVDLFQHHHHQNGNGNGNGDGGIEAQLFLNNVPQQDHLHHHPGRDIHNNHHQER